MPRPLTSPQANMPYPHCKVYLYSEIVWRILHLPTNHTCEAVSTCASISQTQERLSQLNKENNIKMTMSKLPTLPRFPLKKERSCSGFTCGTGWHQLTETYRPPCALKHQPNQTRNTTIYQKKSKLKTKFEVCSVWPQESFSINVKIVIVKSGHGSSESMSLQCGDTPSTKRSIAHA
jgi:hypothetical protein